MSLFTSSLVSSFSSTPTVTLSPARTSNALILRTSFLILRHSLPWPLSAKHTSRNTFSCTLRSSPTQKHVYPDPSPEFSESETQKFKVELLQKLSEDVDEFGDELDAVIDACAQIFSEFLCKEYGGPGTLLVEPFTDMLVALKKKKLPGAPLAARASLLWAQNYVDEDWEVWNSKPK
ncbi:protein PLASTID REDOX INSENSITIVE 2, chloroplastic-like [Gastrolobium bilobum]|uniref:protein PLASTID REDOX INSENSITIVE 2, chloroplastic-like n=1 Tax=Gastrolobium bilobum TaxID=150636 RepID=UPI002AB0739F|nr:protein PLASTID REDOX INSENSITIVE 2, chloroplastic-like [Gastrolobium bilobum]